MYHSWFFCCTCSEHVSRFENQWNDCSEDEYEKWFLVNNRGYVQSQCKMFLIPSLWKEVDHIHVSSAICGAPFVQQTTLKFPGGNTPVFFLLFFFFASILVVWNFFRVSWKIIKYNWAITFLFFWWKCKKLLLPICLYVVCLIRNCKLKKLFFTLVLPNCNFWMLICVNMRVFQISLKVLHHRHLQWFVLWQKKL